MTPSILRGLSFSFACLSTLTGCTSLMPSVRGEVAHTVSPTIQIPAHVERLAILYPKVSAKEILNSYRRLEAATFQLKSQRPVLRIVDRLHLPEILGEQRFQLAGGTSDDSVVRIGRMLGIDSVVIYSIDMPGLRDRALARLYGDLPPVIVTSKLLKIETGEVLYYNVVTSRISDPPGGWTGFGNQQEIQPEILAALERGLRQTVDDLHRAFRE
jgi:hypothetical protein